MVVLKMLKDNVLKNKILIENFTFLSVLQVSNLILFLITIPYLFRILGEKNYGLIVFAQTIVLYFSIFTNFGFNLTATRDISVNRSNPGKISEIVSSVLTIKILFFIFSMLLMITLSALIPAFKEHRMLFLLSMLACLSEALFPIWYFQGIEMMKYITFINVTTRIVATVFIFIVIDNQSRYFLYPLVLGLGTVSGALIALFIVFQKHKVFFRFQTFITLRSFFSENVLYFFSNISTHIYLNANRIIIGSFLGMAEVAYYDIADKVINIIKVPYSLIGQTLFPKVARDRNLRFLNRTMFYTLIYTIVSIAGVFFFSGTIIKFFSGNQNVNTINILRTLSLTLLPITVSIFYGDLRLINFGLRTEYAKMRFFGFFFYVLIFIGLYASGYLGVAQVAVMIVVVETFIASYSYFLCWKAGLTRITG
jgi:O-antigen/teichoic acid export membrane protein